ncbi:hypothetical protein CE91St44_30960 [Oscillospiraceae bacterium]|nr:hypothetical protein CE91St44_30960 [Oscillospiraceae bacterium]
MDASYKIQRGIHVHLIQFFMCPEFWVHIRPEGKRAPFFAGARGAQGSGGPAKARGTPAKVCTNVAGYGAKV